MEDERDCAVLFADVCGSTRLYERIGDARAGAAIVAIETFMSGIVAANSGRVVETVGDEILCQFETAADAARCAIAIQQAVESRPPVDGHPLLVRIGLHCGPVLSDGDRLFGDTLNTAARVAAIAEARQILTTLAAINTLPVNLRSHARRFDRIAVKGKTEALEIYDILWGFEDVTRIPTVVSPPRAARGRQLAIGAAGSQQTIAADAAAFVIGRGTDCDVVIDSALVSRRHCHTAFQRGKFVLVDCSTNGTWVRADDGEEFFLRRETLPLWGSGAISAGKPVDPADPLLVRYRCN